MSSRTRLALGTVAIVAGLGFAADAAAQTVKLDFQLDAAKAEQLGLDVNGIESELSGLINDQLKLDDVGEFMDSMANANAIATKGMGVDYASNPKKFVVGGSLGTGAHDSGFRVGRGEETLPSGGFAAQVSLMAGINLGGLAGAKENSFGQRFLLYAHGMAMPMPSGSELDGSMYNAGANLQIRLANPIDAKVTEWGGIALTAGFERSHYVLQLRNELPLSAPLSGVDLTWTAAGDYQITATTDAIPLELSTNLRVFVITLFAGGGVDLNTSSSFASAALTGPIEADAAGNIENIGTASVTVEADGIGDDMVPRIFVGAQANAMLFKIYGQLNVGMNNSLGGHAGVRVAL